VAALTLDIPVDEITARARQMTFTRFVQSLIALPFYLAGYGMVYVWKASRWCAAAYLVGVNQARGPSKSEQIARLKATVESQRIQLSRFSG